MRKIQETDQGKLTCCFHPILSLGDFFVKLDTNDKGNIEAALPTSTSISSIELTPTDVPGLPKQNLDTTSSLVKILTVHSKC